jgi:hypothetical protein
VAAEGQGQLGPGGRAQARVLAGIAEPGRRPDGVHAQPDGLGQFSLQARSQVAVKQPAAGLLAG